MSGSGGGSGGGSGTGGGGGEHPPGVDCTRILERTILNSPVAEVVRNLRRGDVLTVELRERSLVAVTEDGQIAGALTPPLLPRIVECIGEGYEYIAIVQEVGGGRCGVEVRLKGGA
jgi:hypothetical protein